MPGKRPAACDGHVHGAAARWRSREFLAAMGRAAALTDGSTEMRRTLSYGS